MKRLNFSSEHAKQKKDFVFSTETNPYQLNLKFSKQKKPPTIRASSNEKSVLFSQNVLLRKELQMAKLFKYLPSISSNILQQQFECELPINGRKNKFLDKLLGKPIDIHSFTNIKVLGKNKKLEKCPRIQQIINTSFCEKNNKSLNNHASQQKLQNFVKDKLPRISPKIRSFHVKNEKETGKIVLSREKDEISLENQIKKESIFKIIYPERFEHDWGSSKDQDGDLEDYLKDHS